MFAPFLAALVGPAGNDVRADVMRRFWYLARGPNALFKELWSVGNRPCVHARANPLFNAAKGGVLGVSAVLASARPQCLARLLRHHAISRRGHPCALDRIDCLGGVICSRGLATVSLILWSEEAAITLLYVHELRFQRRGACVVSGDVSAPLNAGSERFAGRGRFPRAWRAMREVSGASRAAAAAL